MLAGKYRVERTLGVGGMGVVVAAHHIQLDDKVAIKFLLPEMLSDAVAVERFAQEARAAVKIKSEYVARVFDVGALDNGTPYMVMEFLDGVDLASWLLQRGSLPVEQAVGFVLQACVAVAEAHTLGIVHRDLKPGNLFCVRRSDGQLAIKVLDFGISKVAWLASSGPAARANAPLGSPFYMSPEQMHSRDVGPETDIWALGVILYELLTAQLPFDGDNVAEVVLKVTSELPRPARKVRPELPEALDVAMLRCLERDRRSRFGDVAQLAKAIAPFGPTGAKASADRIAGIIESAGRWQAAPSRLRALRAELQQTQTASVAVTRHIARLVKSQAGPRVVAAGMAFAAVTRHIARLVKNQAGPRVVAAGMAFVVTVAVVVFGIRVRSRHIADARNTVHAAGLDAPAAVASQPASEPPAASVLPTPTDFPRVPPNVPGRTGSNSIAHPSASQRNRSGPAKANCRVVSFFDRDGDQHFRQECGN